MSTLWSHDKMTQRKQVHKEIEWWLTPKMGVPNDIQVIVAPSPFSPSPTHPNSQVGLGGGGGTVKVYRQFWCRGPRNDE